MNENPLIPLFGYFALLLKVLMLPVKASKF